jgi:hypothetical protein
VFLFFPNANYNRPTLVRGTLDGQVYTKLKKKELLPPPSLTILRSEATEKIAAQIEKGKVILHTPISSAKDIERGYDLRSK